MQKLLEEIHELQEVFKQLKHSSGNITRTQPREFLKHLTYKIESKENLVFHVSLGRTNRTS